MDASCGLVEHEVARHLCRHFSTIPWWQLEARLRFRFFSRAAWADEGTCEASPVDDGALDETIEASSGGVSVVRGSDDLDITVFEKGKVENASQLKRLLTFQSRVPALCRFVR